MVTYTTTGKTIALTRRTLVGKAMSLVFNMLSRLVISFLPRSKRLLISWLQSPSAVILEPPKIKSDTIYLHCFPIYFPWSDGTRCHDLRFLNVEPTLSQLFPLSSFTFIKRLFSSSSLSAIRVVSSAYLRAEELMLLNCGVGEDSWESLGLQGDPTSPFWRRSVLGVLWKEWC